MLQLLQLVFLGQIFLLVDLREFFFKFRVGNKKKKKTLKMTSQWSFSKLFFHFQSFFSISSEQTVKLVK